MGQRIDNKGLDMRLKQIIKLLIPPILLKLYLSLKSEGSKHTFDGPFDTWEEVSSITSGYQDPRIISKLLESANAVLRGEASFQRDGILLDEIEFNWPSLSALLLALSNSSSHHILDIGGGFGQTALQNNSFFSLMPGGADIRYSIVEQSEIVASSTKLVDVPSLTFYSKLKDVTPDFDIVYFGSSAAYIEKVEEMFDYIAFYKPNFIIFDRTPVSDFSEDYYYLEKPSNDFYSGGSYPVRVFSEQKLKNRFVEQFGGGDYRVLAQWNEKFQPYPEYKSIGICFTRL